MDQARARNARPASIRFILAVSTILPVFHVLRTRLRGWEALPSKLALVMPDTRAPTADLALLAVPAATRISMDQARARCARLESTQQRQGQKMLIRNTIKIWPELAVLTKIRRAQRILLTTKQNIQAI